MNLQTTMKSRLHLERLPNEAINFRNEAINHPNEAIKLPNEAIKLPNEAKTYQMREILAAIVIQESYWN
jgi:hypothetical protein